MVPPAELEADGADWRRRVVDRSLRSAARRSLDRGSVLVAAAATLLDRAGGDDFTVQDVADEAGQSLRTLYQYFASKDDLLLAVFEEAMRGYAQLIRTAITPFDDPLERLAGAMLAAIRLPEASSEGSTRGLVRVRLRLTQVQPDQVGLARRPVALAVRELLSAACGADAVTVTDLDAATFVLLSLNTTSITTCTLGNDQGPRTPDDLQVVGFCLRGLGADVDAEWLADVGRRLCLPRRRIDVTTPFATTDRPQESP